MISAIVVSHNEGYLLEACLRSIQFCDEIILVDLESTDNTRDIALKYGAKYIWHKKVPLVEILHTKFQLQTKHDWILITDPDEVCSKELANDIVKILPKLPNDIGAIKVPWQFYFGKKPLLGTQWGGIQSRIFLLNKMRAYFSSEVHRGRHLKEGMKVFHIKFNGKNNLHHYWMQTKSQLLEKHRRYIKNEGESRYKRGLRTTPVTILINGLKALFGSYVTKQGWKDGFIGLYLSLFWSWYIFHSEFELFKYQKKLKNFNHH